MNNPRFLQPRAGNGASGVPRKALGLHCRRKLDYTGVPDGNPGNCHLGVKMHPPLNRAARPKYGGGGLFTRNSGVHNSGAFGAVLAAFYSIDRGHLDLFLSRRLLRLPVHIPQFHNSCRGVTLDGDTANRGESRRLATSRCHSGTWRIVVVSRRDLT
eukprot:gene24103-biopygen7373